MTTDAINWRQCHRILYLVAAKRAVWAQLSTASKNAVISPIHISDDRLISNDNVLSSVERSKAERQNIWQPRKARLADALFAATVELTKPSATEQVNAELWRAKAAGHTSGRAS